MKYTKQQRRDLHKAFKAAEPFLDGQGFLCWALEIAHAAGKIDPEQVNLDQEQVNLAKNLIEHRICPHNTVCGWLHSSVGVPNKELTPTAMQTYRKRWLESLIKEFSE